MRCFAKHVSPTPKGQEKKVFSASKDGIRMHNIKCKLGALKTQCSCFEWAQPDFFIWTTQDLSDIILALPWNTPCICLSAGEILLFLPGAVCQTTVQAQQRNTEGKITPETDSQEAEGTLEDIVASFTSVHSCDSGILLPFSSWQHSPGHIKEDHVPSSRQWTKNNRIHSWQPSSLEFQISPTSDSVEHYSSY